MEYPDFPPTGGGVMVGHMSGSIFLIAWASMGIAIYDEYPEYYDLIENIILDKLVPSQNFMISSGEHPQGSAYGIERINSLLYGDMIFSSMFDNEIHLFDKESFNQACRTFLHMMRPDGELLRIGDEFNEGTRYAGLGKTCFFGSYLYDDPILKGFAKKELLEYSKFYVMGLTPIMILIFNKTDITPAPISDLPLVQYNGYPMGSMYARTSWTDKDAIMTYMKIGECYSGNHEHRDAGNFQIYHKGILASKSGNYTLYGNELDRHYNKQTISCNSILVFDPDRKDTEKWVYSGGHRIDDDYSEEVMDAEDWKTKPSFNIGKVLYHDYKLENGELKYSCLCGDITKAYYEDSVSEVKRYMFSLNTGRADHPLAFFVFDRVTAVKEHFEKKVLLHMQTLPMVIDLPNGKKCAMITNLDSRLYIQSAGSEVNYNLIGGENNNFNVKGVNYEKGRMRDNGLPFTFEFNCEEGWGRIEITPKKPAKTDCMLTVMYLAPDVDYAPKLVFGDSNVLPFRELVEIKGEGYLGGAILNNAVIFPENGDGFGDELSFSVPEDVKKCYVIGLKGGKWNINGKEYEVKEESGIAEFEVTSTDIKLKKC
jgi:heparin/heparan-sulfate lyase